MTERHTDHPPRREADGDAGARFEWDEAPKRHWIRLEPARVTGRRIGPAPTQQPLVGDAGLPTLAEWTERDVWVPPEHAGTRS
jgi:hypothetical protein